ncbi:MAG: Hpt domain-containing protein [Firmicutes bacterium]|nr:Hpt domain-containing protein [Bacillota bacterium]
MKDFDENINRMITETGLERTEINKLVKLFIESIQNYIDEIEVAIINNNFKQIKIISHKLKGASANLRFFEISDCSAELELAADKCDLYLCSSNFRKLLLILGKYTN